MRTNTQISAQPKQSKFSIHNTEKKISETDPAQQRKQLIILTLFRMGVGYCNLIHNGRDGGCQIAYQLFPCNFYKLRNYSQKLSDFYC